MRPTLVELAGPAGAGKTTLVDALASASDAMVPVPLLRFRDPGDALLMLPHTMALAPMVAKHPREAVHLTRRELKRMAQVDAWLGAIDRRMAGRASTALLDHGPLYILVALREFGSDLTKTRAFSAWWNERLHAWALALDLVVLLDAPDDVLAARIGSRSSDHVLKGADYEFALDFLGRYRRAFEDALARIAHFPERPRVMRFETSTLSTEQVRAAVLDAVGSSSSQAPNQRPSSSV